MATRVPEAEKDRMRELRAERWRMKEALSAAYVQLLKYHGPERVMMEYQKLLSDCRDALAVECGTSAEAIQNAHEAKAGGYE